ncbi:hypothetical protein [Butyrivibrio sp. AE3006]|uniref:hypothetical protein n=1 Tax=Butyrivibrio sp. AE3006 TaxID=1280673 RepID=UPI000424D742|nr:hypothetical protein [Butyrivibrio sp. AE3006]
MITNYLMNSAKSSVNGTKQSITSGKIWEKAYALNNYEIEYSDIESEQKTCAIYFSSSGIYYPNTEEQLEAKVIRDNVYEWKNHRINRASKHIFVRDVAKSFYVVGISKKMPTMDAVVDFLKKETEGYEVITLGSSGGAYMATLVGTLLKASCVFTFSCFWSLNKIDYNVWPLVEKYSHDEDYSKYYELLSVVKKCEGNTKYIYIYPAKNRDAVNNDHIQSGLVKDSGVKNIISIGIKTKTHGVCVNSYLLNKLINLEPEKFESFLESKTAFSDFEIANILLNRCDRVKMIVYLMNKKGIKRFLRK